TTTADGIQLHQYAPAQIRTPVATLTVDTAYPYDGVVSVRIETDAEEPWTLSLRVPAWASGATAVVRPVDGLGAADDPGDTAPGAARTVRVRRAFRAGDVVELRLPLAPRFSAPDPRIDAVRGCLAVERGPLVYCLESTDLARASGGRFTDVAQVRLDPSI